LGSGEGGAIGKELIFHGEKEKSGDSKTKLRKEIADEGRLRFLCLKLENQKPYRRIQNLRQNRRSTRGFMKKGGQDSKEKKTGTEIKKEGISNHETQ